MFTLIKILFNIIGIFIVSWLMLHLVAFIGVFLALAYPVWWLIVPRLTPCIGCNVMPGGSVCPFCQEKIVKSDIHPKHLASTVKNSLIMIIISLLSLGMVFGESKLLHFLGIPATPKTVAFIIPGKSQFKSGEIFGLDLAIDGIKTPINAVQADISFDPTKLQIQDISTADSLATIFIQKEISNQTGYARLTGGLPNPGFFSDHGHFGTVYFKSLAPGLTTVTFLPTSMILANDGRGTNVLKSDLGAISYLILPEKITESQATQQTTFFNSQVLGAKTSNNQLTFYSNDESVLGASIATPAKAMSTEELANLRTQTDSNPFLNLLARFNDFTLRFWRGVFNLFKPAP
jgi:hypothetical protein